MGPELGDPNAGEWYRLRRALPAPCHLYAPFGFLDNVFVGVFGAATVVEEMVDDEAVGNSDPMVGEPARDGLFEKRNGCSVSSENGETGDLSRDEALDVKRHAYHQHLR